ncbi:craniofacial development protein 2-like [Nilaparvata lugens]|uniref:craniofacial development protein 2-like n=1 Tax=Nilaparvata lugens TaxID=108931 RepID=UPI00193D1BA2|nr:craniofacial development protein 2-like [Nilaparvata lugens]
MYSFLSNSATAGPKPGVPLLGGKEEGLRRANNPSSKTVNVMETQNEPQIGQDLRIKKRKQTGFGKRKNDLRLFTWNVHTLFRNRALQQFTDRLTAYKADIAAIQEVRWTGDGVIHKRNADFYYSCHKTKHCFGVGFLVMKHIRQLVIDFKAVNERIGVLRVRGRFFNLSIINCHAPTEEKPDEEKDTFYGDLERAYNACPKHDIKVLMGDMNAKIGREEIYKQQAGSHSLHNESNLNGIRLINFAASKGMVISSTSFPRKNIHKETWVSPDMATYYNQIDHVMIDGRHRSNVMAVRTFSGANIDSDHYLVGATLRAQISKVKNIEGAKRKKFNVGALKEDSSQKFKDCVRDNLQVEEDEDPSGMWRSLRDELERIAEDVIGVERQEQTKTWFDYECQEATKKKNTAHMKMQQSRGTRSTAEQYRAMRRAGKRIHKKKKKEW